MSNEKVTIIVSGAALVKDNGSLSGIQVIEREYEFDDPIEFGQFLGPKNVSMRVSTRESDLRIPREASHTWSIKKVKGADQDLYESWAKEFEQSNIGMKELDKEEILLYWLQRTQDETIIELLG